MQKLEDYAQQAKECRRLAAKALLPDIKAYLLQMADQWELLARERAAHEDLQHVLESLGIKHDVR
jgi:hypothetical protein